MKNINDFIELAKRKGKIKDIKEAFKEYPVEEEWHKGKIENILQVGEENYLKIGEVDLAKIEEYKKSFYENMNEES